MESPFVNEARGADEASGRSYDVVLIPDDDNGPPSNGGPDVLSLTTRCQFYGAFPGIGEPFLLDYDNETFPLRRPASAGDLAGVSGWLDAAGVPVEAAVATARIAVDFYARFPAARSCMAVIRVTTVVNYWAGQAAFLNYVAGGDAELQEALRRSEEESGWDRAVPASKAAVAALEKVEIRVPETETEKCVVCIQEFSGGDEATRMPCDHVFHGDCIVKWLEYRPLCPICRFELPSSETS